MPQVYQATLVASAVSLSSTTTTAHALIKSKLRETSYGKALIELMAVQVSIYRTREKSALLLLRSTTIKSLIVVFMINTRNTTGSLDGSSIIHSYGC